MATPVGDFFGPGAFPARLPDRSPFAHSTSGSAACKAACYNRNLILGMTAGDNDRIMSMRLIFLTAPCGLPLDPAKKSFHVSIARHIAWA
jgi:hypothetical protein